MSKKQYIKRHILIMNRLRKKPCSFNDLQKTLELESEFDEENYDISIRTFQRDIKEIASIYGAEINYNKREGVYFIAEEEQETPFERIIEAYETLEALNFSNRVNEKLLLERKGNNGAKYMHVLLHAIENCLEVTFTHHSYWKDETKSRTVHPIAIKESQNRWYLVCFDLLRNDFRNFGLDRIQELSVTKKKFEPIPCDINAMYKNAFGVETYEPVQKIVLMFTAYQAQYIKSLPLHHSQEVIFEDQKWCHFSYFMHPTNDFVMEIMKYGETVSVIEPQVLREDIKNRISKMMALYN
jgi:proteasome accessory factor B